jgi:ribosomal protein L11 methyltransferase
MRHSAAARPAEKGNQLEAIKTEVLAILERYQIRLTPKDLFKALQKKPNTPPMQTIRLAVKQLVANGDLAYTYPYNTTHLELNRRQPVVVSDRIVLAPNICGLSKCTSSRLVLTLDQGDAFGLGDHPTTRLCLQALDRVMRKFETTQPYRKVLALDIGTGTGVLALAAAGLGAHLAVGIDIDPAAVHEAQHNIDLNHLGHKVRVTQASLASFGNHRFNLVMANLRPPTLSGLLPQIPSVCGPDAYWIFSGFRTHEAMRVKSMLEATNAGVVWQEWVQDWAVVVAHWKNHSESASAGGRTGHATPLVSV